MKVGEHEVELDNATSAKYRDAVYVGRNTVIKTFLRMVTLQMEQAMEAGGEKMYTPPDQLEPHEFQSRRAMELTGCIRGMAAVAVATGIMTRDEVKQFVPAFVEPVYGWIDSLAASIATTDNNAQLFAEGATPEEIQKNTLESLKAVLKKLGT